MRKGEHLLQVSCVKYFRLKYPKHIIYAIPNGGARNIVVATNLKAEGVLSGIPDLHVPIARGGYHSLYIELKDGKKGRVSDTQKAVMDYLTTQGHLSVVARDLDTFMAVIDDYMNNKIKKE